MAACAGTAERAIAADIIALVANFIVYPFEQSQTM
jgi:hypothetical protein